MPKTSRTRRGYSEGSIYEQRPGLWCACLSIGTRNAKRRRRYVYGKTKREVQDKLTELRHQHLAGLAVDPSRETVDDYLARWLEAIRPGLRKTTVSAYSQAVRLHIVPHIGTIRLQRLRAVHIAQFLGALETAGAKPPTMAQAWSTLNSALNRAVEWGEIAANPCARTRRPRVQRKPLVVWDVEQMQAFLRAARRSRYYAMWVLAITTGLRRGELRGLRWPAIDLERGTVTVRKTVQNVDSELVEDDPKTASSKRTIRIPAPTVEALREHRKRMLAEGNIGALVFCTRTGGAPSGANVRDRFRTVVRRAGIPMLTLHTATRHGHASMLLALGADPVVVAQRLGHASPTTTMAIYAHVIPRVHDGAVDRLGDLLQGDGADDAGEE